MFEGKFFIEKWFLGAFQENITCYPQAWLSIRVFSLRCLSRVHTLFILPTTKPSLNLKWRHVQFMLFRRIIHGPTCYKWENVRGIWSEKKFNRKLFLASSDYRVFWARIILWLRNSIELWSWNAFGDSYASFVSERVSIAYLTLQNVFFYSSMLHVYVCSIICLPFSCIYLFNIRWNDGILSLFLPWDNHLIYSNFSITMCPQCTNCSTWPLYQVNWVQFSKYSLESLDLLLHSDCIPLWPSRDCFLCCVHVVLG